MTIIKEPHAHRGHAVRFYGDSGALCCAATEFLAEGLEAGQSGVLIGVEPHRRQILAGLVAAGIDTTTALMSRHLVVCDACELLDRFMLADSPHPGGFEDVMDGLLRRIECGGGLRIYGEMVDVLCAAHQRAAALALEELWNAYVARHEVFLLCAYKFAHLMETAAISETLEAICRLHDDAQVVSAA